MLHHVAFVRTDASEEHITSMIRVTRIGELVTTLAVLADSFHANDGENTFLQNVSSYKSHML
jgi:hypothetical protein